MVKSQNIRILDILSNATGELAEGEIFELVKTGDLQTAYNEYFDIIKKKTAVLFAAACEIGAVLSNRNENEVTLLKEYGSNIGMAFQLIDDALDYISTDKKFGKKIGIDIEEGKVTLPLIISLQNTDSKEHFDKIKEIFYQDASNEKDTNFLKKFVIENKGIDKTFEIATEFIETAKLNISNFEDTPVKNAFIELADFVVKRRF